jgi:hypothetical protein
MSDCASAMDDCQRSDLQSRPRVDGVSTEQAGGFAILRRAWVEGDRVPQDRGDALDAGAMGRRCGLNLELARRAVTQIGDAWVVPGNGHVALLLVGGGAVCSATNHVMRQGTVTWTSGRMPPENRVHGLIADGVEEITLFAENGASVTAVVTDNVYGVLLAGQFELGRFNGPAGMVEFGPAV